MRAQSYVIRLISLKFANSHIFCTFHSQQCSDLVKSVHCLLLWLSTRGRLRNMLRCYWSWHRLNIEEWCFHRWDIRISLSIIGDWSWSLFCLSLQLFPERFLLAPIGIHHLSVNFITFNLVQVSLNDAIVNITKSLIPSAMPETSSVARTEEEHHNNE